ncbi:MAG: type II toxin-antitoxin system RelB/DinJ family antitoxin [candidate division KSB1 bacterium]|nr:type II toxin-antitoxin system RelB/DinJ family antitoxin [candidate division KSB1 bacterium]MDZ7363842.1 type II toxin-antitoxin system RelB/DinJ family antitoxin [candidate division KSB1 bacterium]
MPKAAVIKTRIAPDLKTEVEGILKDLGLSTTEAIALFFYQIKLHRRLPFKIPNKTTRKTFEDTDAGRNLVHYESMDDMLKDLKK